MNKEELAEYHKRDSERKANKKKENMMTPVAVVEKEITPYHNRQSYGKAMKRDLHALPFSPREKLAIVRGLAENVGINSIRRKYREVSQSSSKCLQ